MSGGLLSVLLGIVDRMNAKVTWIALKNQPGWKCFVSGIELPSHMGLGGTPLEALADVLRLAKALSVDG